MKVIYAYVTDHQITNTNTNGEHEKMLVLEDNRAVILVPHGADIIVDSETTGILAMLGCATLSEELLARWECGYEIMSIEDGDTVASISEHLDRLDIMIALIPGPDRVACVPAGYVRFVSDVGAFVTVRYELAVSALADMDAVQDQAQLIDRLADLTPGSALHLVDASNVLV